MKPLIAILFLFSTLFSQAVPPGATLANFSRVREVAIGAPLRQNYVVVDTSVWQFARPDLADVRLYDGATEVPFSLRPKGGGVDVMDRPANILNLGSVGGQTEFDLDVRDIPRYDRVRLHINAKDFVAGVEISGRKDLNQNFFVRLASATIFDFSREKLGSSSVLKLPASTFRYLHVKVKGIAPEQVTGAGISNLEDEKTSFANAGDCHSTSLPPKTIFICSLVPAIPVSHLVFPVAAAAGNFRRDVLVTDSKGVELRRGQISRVHLAREGRAVDYENLAVDIAEVTDKQLTIAVDNGNEPPLPLNTVLTQYSERRLYFNPGGKIGLKLYYGDSRLTAPAYDYARSFEEAPDPEQAKLSPDMPNPGYTEPSDNTTVLKRRTVWRYALLLLAACLLTLLGLRRARKGIR